MVEVGAESVELSRKRRAVSEPSSASDTDSEPAAAPQGRGRGLGRGRQARTVGGRGDAIDDGWRLLEGEESEATVLDFDDRNIGYKGDQDLSDADPIAFLQLFWVMLFLIC